MDYDFSGLLHPQDLFGREYVTMGGVIDHHLTTTVQLSCKMSEKLVVMTNNRLFLVLGRNCAESTKFTFQRQSIPSCRSSPTRKARGSNPPGRTKSSTLWGAALFVMRGFYGAVKERIRTARAPRFASRGAETPRWGASRARLGEPLWAHQKSPCNVLCKVIFCLLYFCFNSASATYHRWRLCTAPA